MIEFTQELFDKYDKMIWKIINKKLNVKNKATMWRIDLEDLHSEAMIAFAQACEQFDESKGFQFSTYLYCAVNNQIGNYLRTHSRAFSISQSQNRLITSVSKAISDGLTLEEVAKMHNMTVEEIIQINDLNCFDYSLDYQVDAGNGEYVDFSEAVSAEEDESAKVYSDLEEMITSIKTVSKHDKELYCRAKGILGYQKETLKALADEEGEKIYMFRKKFEETCNIIENEIKKMYSF